MSLTVELLATDSSEEYDAWLLKGETSLLYASYRYRSFLKRVLDNSQPVYLLAREHGSLVGAVPAFVYHNSRFGNVINSLPFFGSNGGVIVHPQTDRSEHIRKTLLGAFHELAGSVKAGWATLISNPLDTNHEFYEENFGYTYQDERIGQLTPLPAGSRGDTAIQDELMASFHQKTRSSIRKAQKSGVSVRHTDSQESMTALAELHRQNMEAIGGQFKGSQVFDAVRDVFEYDTNYRVYVAEKDGAIIAALLVFFYNRTTEYFTPATAEAARIFQPMSLLVFEAMCEATRRGCRYWNWGGTWLDQGGVYFFKSRWGTHNIRYRYYIREYTGSHPIRGLTPDIILKEYPFFYVLPFSVLERKA
jgi:hypothetical protein